MSNWRQEYFNEISCQGIIKNAGDGNLTINGVLKGYEHMDVDIIYWAAATYLRRTAKMPSLRYKQSSIAME